jgi:5-methylcytosine-specific restriction endonuclease McrA
MALKVLKPRLKAVDTRTARPEPKAYQPVYYSRAWRRLVALLKLERGEYCQACGKYATYLEADHIVELKDGGAPLDPANVRLLCRPCHARKTNRARDERLARSIA